MALPTIADHQATAADSHIAVSDIASVTLPLREKEGVDSQKVCVFQARHVWI